jgi:hypothetical protein
MERSADGRTLIANSLCPGGILVLFLDFPVFNQSAGTNKGPRVMGGSPAEGAGRSGQQPGNAEC